ncbi:AAA family ATPase [Catenuloplanes sp. NPDC051500]|uniref:AAA family ATPase n=1 Tax=Catenuloplanes sp. NPDC051500 TaxID=3363959 RepID=UPI0037897574
MGAVLITGVSGSGKSTLARVLAARGARAVDADEDPSLTWWVDADGNPAATFGTDTEWLLSHRWLWNAARMDALIAAAGPETLFVCGNASNDLDLWDRFDQAILLVVDERTMLERLDDPRRDNDYGTMPDERALLCQWLPGFHEERLARGAVPVDATLPLAEVAAAVLAAVRPLSGVRSYE